MRPTKRPRFSLRGQQEISQADALPNGGQTASNTTEVMWLRDFLPDLIPNARIATYSYKSDWRKADVKTCLRKCGEQLLNVLHQNRPTEMVGEIVSDIFCSLLLRIVVGASSTAGFYWT